MSGPGDRASKPPDRWEPTLFPEAEGHGDSPTKVDEGMSLPPGSWSSARTHMPHAREPGDLRGASPPVVGGRRTREGKPQCVVGTSQKSDEAVVPGKSAKTWVTPVESMEERAEAKGHPRYEKRCRHRTALNARSYGGSGHDASGRFSLSQGGSPVREIRPPGSVRGAARKGRPYRDPSALGSLPRSLLLSADKDQ